MIPRLRILRTKSHSGIAIPLGAKRTVDGQTVEVLGLIKRQVKNQFVLQWWIVAWKKPIQKYRRSGGGRPFHIYPI